MEKTMSSEKRHRIEWYVGLIFFIAFIGAHLLFSAKAAVKVAGVACVASGLLWMIRRSVPVGIEGRSPSFYLGGFAAFIAGAAMLVVGVALLVYSALATCLLGWASDGEC